MHMTSLGRRILGVGVAAMVASTANATQYFYDLSNHPDGGLAPPTYGYDGMNVGDGWLTFNGTKGDWLFVVTPSSETEPVPEPATVALIGLGLAGVAGVRRRRKR